MSLLKLTLSIPEDSNQINEHLKLAAGDAQGSLVRLSNYIEQVKAGARHAYIKTHRAAVQATASITLTGLPTAAETFVLNGVTFTARASGAVANEYNIGASAALTAVAIAAAINASVTAKVSGYVTAEAASGVVTITATEPGLAGNMFTLAETLSNATRVDFAGGSNGTEVILQLGKSSI